MADDRPPEALEPREPTVEDLRDLCRALNSRGAKYIVVGGFAMRAAQYSRQTMDIDLLVDASRENEAIVFEVAATLPDHAAAELVPGELLNYNVIRVADEIVLDIMRSAGGITYQEVAGSVQIHEIDGVAIPFASPELLWKMKSITGREKDLPDLLFLRQWFAERGRQPPEH